MARRDNLSADINLSTTDLSGYIELMNPKVDTCKGCCLITCEVEIRRKIAKLVPLRILQLYAQSTEVPIKNAG